MFAGFVTLGNNIVVTVLTKNTSNTPTNAASLPVFRVYGPTALMTNGTGTTSFKDTASVTGATNVSPIVITSNGHGLTTGTRVTITGVLGNTAANGTFQVTFVDTNSFSLDSSTGNGAYTSGGTWNATGLYTATITASAANGYASGTTYAFLSTYTVSSTVMAQLITFTVV